MIKKETIETAIEEMAQCLDAAYLATKKSQFPITDKSVAILAMAIYIGVIGA